VCTFANTAPVAVRKRFQQLNVEAEVPSGSRVPQSRPLEYPYSVVSDRFTPQALARLWRPTSLRAAGISLRGGNDHLQSGKRGAYLPLSPTAM